MSEIERKTGHVYFAVSGDFKRVKIGFSTCLGQRIANLKTGNHGELHVWDSFPADAADEKSLHACFKKYRIEREWFKFSKEIDVFLEDVEFARREIVKRRVQSGRFKPTSEEEILDAMDNIQLLHLVREVGGIAQL